MNFQLKAVVENVVASGNHANGPWFLYSVKEKIGAEKTKTWRVFCGTSLFVGVEYDLQGYISESPNKAYKNDGGKHPYQTSYNAIKCLSVEAEIPF